MIKLHSTQLFLCEHYDIVLDLSKLNEILGYFFGSPSLNHGICFQQKCCIEEIQSSVMFHTIN